jgi:hypothetical protein
VVEQVGLLLKQRLDLGLVEAQSDEMVEGTLDDFGASLHPFPFGKGRTVLNRIPASDLGGEQAFLFQLLVGLPYCMEGYVELVAEGAGRWKRVLNCVVACGNEITKLFYQLLADGRLEI